MARELVSRFLQKYQEVSDIDESLIDYISEYLLDAELAGSSLSDLEEIIATSSPGFDSIPGELRMEELMHLRAQIASLLSGNEDCAAIDQGEEVGPLLEKITIGTASGSLAAETNHLQQTQAGLQIEHNRQPTGYSEEGPAAQTLVGLCPSGICVEFLQHILDTYCDGDLQRAAEWILECEDIERRHSAWESAADRRRREEDEARKAEQRVRKAILARFDLEVRKTEDDFKRDAAKPLQPWTKQNEGTKAKQVRYREGMVASTKGEKYVVQKLGEEWDGGSKGKVYTKGKRGKGFA